MLRYRSIVVGLVLSLSPVVASGQAIAGGLPALALIVNSSNPTTDVTLDEVRALWALNRQFWPSGRRLVLFLPPSNSPQKEILLERVYAMSDAQLRRFWTAQLFQGAIPAIPSTLKNGQAVASAVQRSEAGMAAVLASEVPPGVLVLSIDGKRPGEPGYPLARDTAP